MSKSFDGKVVLVTGANSGIGESTAAAFREAGAKVFGLARRKDAIEAARSKHPHIHWLLGDVAKESDVTLAIDGLVKEAGRLDIVVNNAGAGTFTSLADSTADSVRAQFEINVFGPTYVTRAALPALTKSKGTVVNIGSAAGHKAVPGAGHYAATKAALESLTRSWALELAPLGIRVNLIAPGPTETPVFGKLGAPPEQVEAVKAQFVKMVPLGRIASAEEISRWVLHLADPSVTWVTGQILSIDGGMSL